MIVLSASQFEEEARCFRYWAFRRVYGLPEVKTTAQGLGTAFALLMERWLKGEEPFQDGWDAELDEHDRDLARRLLEAAKRHPELSAEARKKIRHVEPEFVLDILAEKTVCTTCGTDDPWEVCFGTAHEWACFPKVVVLGYPDVVTEDGVDDHKTTKGFGWAKTPEMLRSNIQLTVYAKAWLEDRRSDGIPDPEHVQLRHHNYCKLTTQVETRAAQPPLTPSEIETHWLNRITQAEKMRRFIVENKIKDDLQLEKGWSIIPAAGTPNDARNRKGACGEYRGCPFAPICGEIKTPAEYRRETIELLENHEREARGLPSLESGGYMTASIFGARNAAAAAANGTATAAPPVATAPPPPPAAGAPSAPAPSAPPAPPAAPPAAAGLPTAPPTPARKEFPIWPGTFPVARKDCGACVEPDAQNVMHSTGIVHNKGHVCRICSNKNQGEGKVHGGMFETEYANGVFAWAAKPEFRDTVEAAFPGQSTGEVRLPWMPQAGTTPAAPPAAAAPPAPPAPAAPPPPAASAPPAAPPPPLPAAAAPPAPAAPAPAPAAPPPPAPATTVTGATQTVNTTPTAPAAGTETGSDGKSSKTKPVKFILYLDCGPRGGVNGVVRLDAIFNKYAALLAAQEGKDSYWEIPPFVRREKMASAAPKIAEAEKFFSSKYVVGTTGTPDMREFCEAFASFADEVFVPFGRG